MMMLMSVAPKSFQVTAAATTAGIPAQNAHAHQGRSSMSFLGCIKGKGQPTVDDELEQLRRKGYATRCSSSPKKATAATL